MSNTIVVKVDLTGCRHAYDMHDRLCEAFGFPEWYGKNWDAFWDLLSEPDDYTVVELTGVHSLPESLRPQVDVLLKLLQENKEKWDEYMEKDGRHDRRFAYTVLS